MNYILLENLKDNQIKGLIRNWYYKSDFSNSSEIYYKSI